MQIGMIGLECMGRNMARRLMRECARASHRANHGRTMGQAVERGGCGFRIRQAAIRNSILRSVGMMTKVVARDTEMKVIDQMRKDMDC